MFLSIKQLYNLGLTRFSYGVDRRAVPLRHLDVLLFHVRIVSTCSERDIVRSSLFLRLTVFRQDDRP